MIYSNYFFIDGSALTAQIRQLQRAKPEFRKRKLDPQKFVNHFMTHLRDLHGGQYKRATFYFPKGDEVSVGDYVSIPNHKSPGKVKDVHFKFCGHKLKKSAEFQEFVEKSVPTKFQSRFSKSEKGIDIQICCDALGLASSGRLERLFLLTNDSDFLPLFYSLKDFGANISIIHLCSSIEPNAELLREADSYDVVDDAFLDRMFSVAPPSGNTVADSPNRVEAITSKERPQSEKPETTPSDLSLAEEVETGK